MNLLLHLPELVQIKKYQKINGKAVYRSVLVPASEIIEQCESLVFLIRQRQRFKFNDFVNISSTDLIRIVGNNYKEIATILIKHKIIKVNDIFLAGIFSKAYCFDDELFPAIKNHYSSTRLYEHTALITRLYEGTPEFILKRSQGCMNDVETFSDSNTEKVPQCHTTRLVQHLQNIIKLVYNQKLGIPVIQPRISVGKDGRFHSILTSMPKEIRSKLVDDEGNPLVQVDFSTSHLQHLIPILEKEPTIDPDELYRFKKSVLEQDFYNSTGFGNITRDEMKTCVNKGWLTCSFKNRKGVKLLKSLYKSITNYIEKINDGGHSSLPHILTHSESNLINHTVLQAIADDDRDILAFSVYDCIVVEPKYLNHVLKLVNEAGLKLLAFRPKLKITYNEKPVTEKPVQEKKNLTRSKGMKKNKKEPITYYPNYNKVTKPGTIVGEVDISSDDDDSVEVTLAKLKLFPLHPDKRNADSYTSRTKLEKV